MKDRCGRAASLMLVFSLLLEPVSLAAALSDDKGGYESQAAAKLQQSNELQSKIDNVSEEKRALDEAADAAIKEHEARKAELDATDARLKQNEEELATLQKDYEAKQERLGRRVRDIYINGQVSYLDVLFGAHDFQDFLTRMDLLKRIIRQDYALVRGVQEEKDSIELRQASLAQDRLTQAEQEEKAHLARADMEEKVKRREALIERLRTDKALIDQQYEELMRASRQIGSAAWAARRLRAAAR